jgi:hypothetical protein
MKKPASPGRKKPRALKSPVRLKWLCVLEIDDAVAPRRDPGKPNVRVEALSVKPGADMDAWVKNSRQAKKWRVTGVLKSEMPDENHAGGLLRPYRCPVQNAQVKKALADLRERLRCRRYTVNGDQTTWRVYVIELDATRVPGIKPQHKGAVYVGQTSLSREERAQIHREGKARTKTGQRLWNEKAHAYYKGLRLDLIPASYRKDFFCESAAKNEETKLMLHLKSLGYKTFGGRDREKRYMAAAARKKT